MKHLLIIEDDKIDQMAFERFAKNERFPFTYQFANSIKEAKQALKNHKFDLILTDYFLGDGTMFEMLDLKLDIPVIVTTGT
ncbi:MAG: diguanylate cyclase, partial [Flavobacteriales bacterium CG03_land_8_20_14_0_80_35_15]